MPDIDERLRAGLQRLAVPPDPSGAFERVVAKRAHRRLLRRLGTAALVVTVLAGTAAGTYALARVFGVGATAKRHLAGGSNLPGNGKIAFVRSFETADSGSTAAVYVMEPDGTGLERLSSELPAAADLRWSLDGTRLAMAATPGSSSNGYTQIYVLNADDSDLTQLTRDPSSEDIDPAWSPDGEKIVFAKWSDDGTSSGLYVTGADGNGQTRLTDSARLDSSPAWFPDGSRILFKRDTEGVTQLFVVNADASGERALGAPSGGYIGSLELSPDGRKLVFTRLDPSFGQKNFEIFVANADGTGEARLTETAVPEGAPTWSPDGTSIAFVRAGDIYTMAADGSEVRRLTDSGSDGWPAWQALPTSTGTLIPSPQPTPSGAQSPPVEGTTTPLPDACNASTVTGDFDGDGVRDSAMVATDPCPPGPSGQPPQHYSLSVHWGNGASGSIDIPECAAAPDTLAPRCQALAASDLSGDGRDELVLLLENGPVSWMEAYELSESEAFGQQPVTVAPPGDLPDFPPGKPFVVHVGPDPLGSVTCRTTDTKQRQIIVSYSRVSDDHTMWQIHETVFVLDPGLNAPYGEVTVGTTNDRTAPVNPSGGAPPVEGNTCPGM